MGADPEERPKRRCRRWRRRHPRPVATPASSCGTSRLLDTTARVRWQDGEADEQPARGIDMASHKTQVRWGTYPEERASCRRRVRPLVVLREGESSVDID